MPDVLHSILTTRWPSQWLQTQCHLRGTTVIYKGSQDWSSVEGSKVLQRLASVMSEYQYLLLFSITSAVFLELEAVILLRLGCCPYQLTVAHRATPSPLPLFVEKVTKNCTRSNPMFSVRHHYTPNSDRQYSRITHFCQSVQEDENILG